MLDLPELDRIDHKLGPHWRSALQYIRRDDISDDDICDKLMEGLTKDLRAIGGVPGFNEIASAVANSNECNLNEHFARLDEIAMRYGGHKGTKIAVEVAKSCIAKANAEDKPCQESKCQFAEKICVFLLKNCFFDIACPDLLNDGTFADHEDAMHRQIQLEQKMKPAIEKVAQQLVQKPDVSTLRAPKRTSMKQSTHDLLSKNLLS